MITIPRIAIAAPHSGSGKSTVTTGLMRAFSAKHVVQGFKAGPDYIDPGYHTAATGRPSRNLDTWMLPHEAVKRSIELAQSDAGIAIIEGVMGLYDGYDALTERGSTAELAKLTNTPIIVVIDASAMARTAGAVALGMRAFDPDVNVQGVICNRVGSETHAQWVTEAIESVGIPVLGCIPRLAELHLPERHLGLHMAHEEGNALRDFLQVAAEVMTQHLDLERIWQIAEQAAPVTVQTPEQPQPLAVEQSIRIGVAKDEAFCFYYQDNFDYLTAAGAELVTFSPLHDATLPPGLQGLYLGGGYPELYAEQLAANQSMMHALKGAIHAGLPTYAECGGLMVLTQQIVDQQGKVYPMLGLLPGYAVMRERVRLGYREVTALQDTLVLPASEATRGHEFHYSDWENRGDAVPAAYRVTPRHGQQPRSEGYAVGNLLASYVHLHFGANPLMARRFVEQCRQYQSG